MTATVPAAREARALASLNGAAAVAFAEPARVVTIDQTPIDPSFANALSWAYERPGFPAAWDVTTGSAAVTVAVVDTGVSPVADLAGALVPGHNFVSGTDDASDDNGHGTEVAATIAARGDNGIGTAGACWSCRIMPVKVADAAGRGYDVDVAAGIEYAVDHGARIVNVSLAGSQSTDVLAAAAAYAEAHGVLVVAAAGNQGDTQVGYPAGYPGVLSVAGSDANDARYGWSSYGTWVDVAAPGCVETTSSSGAVNDVCGTSFAAPLAAGLAALLLSEKPGATGDQLAQAIEDSAAPVAGGYVAHGRIDAAAALAALGVSTAAPVAADSAPRTTSGVRGKPGAPSRIRQR